MIDGIVAVTTRDAQEMARRLAHDEGIFCGTSSGCNVVAALEIARAHREPDGSPPSSRTRGNATSPRREFGGPAGDVDIPDREHDLDERTVAMLDRHAPRLEVLGATARSQVA